MSRSEAEHFVTSGEGRICIRYYRRRDGSIITRNCPVGLQALKRKMSAVARAVCSGVLTFLSAVGLYETLGSIFREPPMMGTMAIERELLPLPPQVPVATDIPLVQGEMVYAPQIKSPEPRVLMGRIVAVPPKPHPRR